ncbi:hypothetical protein LINGRAHAP2_LOCUS14652, partial [Linum grandiflorum]
SFRQKTLTEKPTNGERLGRLGRAWEWMIEAIK